MEIMKNEPEAMQTSENDHPKENNHPSVSPKSTKKSMNLNQSISNEKTTDIIALNPYQTKWVIKGRVTQKGQIRQYNKNKSGKLFSFTLTDASGDVKITGFNQEVDKYYDLFEMGKVYTISKGSVKQANRQYNSCKCDYEVTLSGETIVAECDDSEAPQEHYDFVPIGKLGEKNVNDFVDIIGVVHEFEDATSIFSKNSQKDLIKRVIKIVDQSNCSVSLTLWGEDAKNFEAHNNPSIVCKGLKVSDFNGRSLSTTMQSTILLDPKNIPDAARLRGWYQMEGNSIAFDAFKSENIGGGGSQSNKISTIQETQGPEIGSDDKPVYFSIKAEATYFKKENYLYKGCSSEGCGKKLVETGAGCFRCEKCAKEGSDFTWKAILSMKLADSTGQLWAIGFKESVEKILNVDLNQLGSYFSEDNISKTDEYFEEAVFKPFIFRLRLKREVYNDESRMRASILDSKPVSYAEYNKTLLNMIKEITPQS